MVYILLMVHSICYGDLHTTDWHVPETAMYDMTIKWLPYISLIHTFSGLSFSKYI